LLDESSDENMVSVIRVKVSMRGGPASPDLSQFVGNPGNRWGNCRFSINGSEEEADVWLVYEDLDDSDTACVVPPSRTAFLSAETSWGPGFYSDSPIRMEFLRQFALIYTCHDIYLPSVVNSPPFLPWMINGNHGASFLAPHHRDLRFFEALNSIEKRKDISVFCSTQSLTAEHRMRLRFVEELKAHFGERLDWFGNGVNPLPQKWEGIAPYRYTLVLENQSADSVFTEKIYDAFLGLSYPIYWGAPDLDRFFDRSSFTAINIRDLHGSIETITSLIDSSVAEERVDALVESKNRVLNQWNLFGRLARVAEELVAASPEAVPTLVSLQPWSSRSPSRLRGGVRGMAGRALGRAARQLARDADSN
jgi:hypothetical protein